LVLVADEAEDVVRVVKRVGAVFCGGNVGVLDEDTKDDDQNAGSQILKKTRRRNSNAGSEDMV
jgi:hypothetical protein